MKKNKIDIKNIQKVELHPIFGIRPGKIILILLILVLLLASFLLFLLPGLINSGRYVSFSSSFSQVGILIDDKYIGSSEGSNYYLENGTYNVKYIKDSKLVSEDTLTIDKALFFTLFNKPIQEVKIDIIPSDDIFISSYERALEDINRVSAVTTYDESYNYKPIISLFIQDAIASNKNEVIDEILNLSLFITSDVMLKDLNKAISILENNNIEYKSDEFNFVYSSLNDVLKNNYSNNNIVNNSCISFDEENDYFLYDLNSFTIGNINSELHEQAINIYLKPFKVKTTMVSEYDYALFVEDNPYWKKDNIDKLIQDGMVDSSYLAGVYLAPELESVKPIVNISYNAALAYIEYISVKDGIDYRLLTETEAEVFLTDSDYSENIYDIPSALGGLWELTASPFVPLARLSNDIYNIAKDNTIADIIIKGGSYINSSNDIKPYTVGVTTKSSCSDYMGFRLVQDI